MQDRCHYAKQTEAVASMGLKSGPKERGLTEEEFVKREQEGERVWRAPVQDLCGPELESALAPAADAAVPPGPRMPQ